LTKDSPYSSLYGFRENSARYRFEGDRIVPDGRYPGAWRTPDLFTGDLSLVGDFARESGFREFYRENRSFYEEQIRKYGERVPFKRVWAWLEENFPERHDGIRIVFSPLAGGSHSMVRCDGDGFREVIAIVSGPGGDSEDWNAVREGKLTRVAFTEIDHAYVNPLTFDDWFSVGGSFYRTDFWNGQEGYRDPLSTFNEYMTWAVFLLYADHTYDDAAFAAIRDHEVDTMVNRRKFVRFGQFSEELLRIYRARAKEETVQDLYPEILKWAEKEQADAAKDQGSSPE
jgi:hypothetical protein